MNEELILDNNKYRIDKLIRKWQENGSAENQRGEMFEVE